MKAVAVSSIALEIYFLLAFVRFYPFRGSVSAVRLCKVAFAQRFPLFSLTEGKREEEEAASL